MDLVRGVHRAVGLVEQQQHPGVVDERTDDLRPPRHARGHLARVLAGDVGEPGLGELLNRHLPRLGRGQAPLDHRPVGDVVAQGLPRKEGAVLEHHHPIRTLARERAPLVAQHLAVEPDLAGGDRVEARDGVEQGRLPASRRPHDHADFARADLQRAVVHGQHVDPFRVVDLRHVADADRTRARPAGHQRPLQRQRTGTPLHHPVAREAYGDRGAPSDEAQGDHADHHRHRHVVHEGVDDEVAEAPVARHHLRRDEREPRHPRC